MSSPNASSNSAFPILFKFFLYIFEMLSRSKNNSGVCRSSYEVNKNFSLTHPFAIS